MTEKEELYRHAEKRVGTLLKGKYQIDRLLGIGGMAAVYAATHRNRMRFAVKMLHPELSVRTDVRKRFVREGYIANLVDHPGVVTVIDDDVSDDGAAYLVMELLDGVGVEKLCRQLGDTIPAREVLGIAHQLLEVLTAAHAKTVVHRDIKPGNLFITREGQVKVLDFGIARLKEAATELKLTRTGARMGTPAFMSPEQAMAKSGEIDACTDIWSVGATLFRMLSGYYVHQGDNASEVVIRAATEPARPLAEVAPHLPGSVVDIVDRALAFEKKARFASAALMRDAVETAHLELYGALSDAVLSSYIASECEDTAPSTPPSASEALSSHTALESDDAASLAEPSSAGDSFSIRSVPEPKEMAAPPTKGKRRMLPLLSVLGAVGLAFATGFLVLRTPNPAPGTLTVKATTDMLVPTDVDWLTWRLVRRDTETVEKQGAIPLMDWKSLPALLTEISTTQLPEPALLEVVARRGGKTGEIILKRSVEIAAPKSGQKQLVVSLDWLCSEGALATPCDRDEICRAGACVAKKHRAPIYRDFKATASAKCFDTERCFASGMVVTVPPTDPATGECILNQSHATMNAEKKNIALVVNTSAVGNFGVCGPAGQCLIPIDRDSPAGWEILRENGVVTGIRLPAAVCKDIGLGKLRGVAIVPAISGCPPKNADMPLCPAPDTCVPSEDICPKDLPTAWEGFTCSGAASPQMLRKDLIGCFIPPKRSEQKQPGGQWCCSTGEAPGNDPLLIDDMSGGPQLKLIPPKDYRGGMWWTASDAKGVELSPPPNPALFTLSPVTPAVTIEDERTFERAACFSSPGFAGWIALMGFNFVSAKEDAMAPPFDVSPYTGIRFWGVSPRGDQDIKIGFADQNTYTEDARSTCNQNPKAGRCGDDWSIQHLTLTDEWKEYFVKWSDLKQSSINWGQARFDAFDATRVFTAYFAVNGKGPKEQSPPFEVCVSQIFFTK